MTSTTLSLSIGATRGGLANLQGVKIADPRETVAEAGENQKGQFRPDNA